MLCLKKSLLILFRQYIIVLLFVSWARPRIFKTRMYARSEVKATNWPQININIGTTKQKQWHTWYEEKDLRSTGAINSIFIHLSLSKKLKKMKPFGILSCECRIISRLENDLQFEQGTVWIINLMIDGNYTRILRTVLNKSCRQNPPKQQLCWHLPPITKTIQVRGTRHAGHCWRSKDKLISDVLLLIPSHGRAKVRRSAKTYIQQLCADTGYRLEVLPEAMDERDE